MKKILIIGKKSFIGSHLYTFLNKFLSVRILSYKDLILTDLKSYDYIINCAIHPNYFKYKYNDKFDIDIKIAKFIKKFKSKYIFLNT